MRVFFAKGAVQRYPRWIEIGRWVWLVALASGCALSFSNVPWWVPALLILLGIATLAVLTFVTWIIEQDRRYEQMRQEDRHLPARARRIHPDQRTDGGFPLAAWISNWLDGR